jgi:hypothetical protein
MPPVAPDLSLLLLHQHMMLTCCFRSCRKVATSLPTMALAAAPSTATALLTKTLSCATPARGSSAWCDLVQAALPSGRLQQRACNQQQHDALAVVALSCIGTEPMVLVLRCRPMQGEAHHLQSATGGDTLHALTCCCAASTKSVTPTTVIVQISCRPNTNGSQFFLCTVRSAATA